MKAFTAAAVFTFCVYVSAQSSTSETLPPSPTESVGCEPHGDHWHCEAAATATGLVSSAGDDATESAGPSPTESIGCEPHGDHWHCEGPAVTGTAGNATATDDDSHDHDDDEHTDAEGTGTLPPSPTASVGCEPHGDHWHCDGPASATDAAAAAGGTSASGSASVTPAQQTGSSGGEKLFVGAGVAAIALVAAL